MTKGRKFVVNEKSNLLSPIELNASRTKSGLKLIFKSSPLKLSIELNSMHREQNRD